MIIGGGIHGVHLAVRLLAEAEVPPDRIRLVDPAAHLLASWHRCTQNTGMRFLRSPAVHHLDVDPWSLLQFAGSSRRGRRTGRGLFCPPYNRPSVDLFAAHSADVIARHGLEDLHVRDRAASIELACDRATVRLASGATLQTRQVLLALGASEQPRWPTWARTLRDEGAFVQHVFGHDTVIEPAEWPDRVAVVGGGITAAQAALRLAEGGRTVHLVARHGLRKHDFDSDPGWIGPCNMRALSATPDLQARRRMISEARHAGSLSQDVYRAIQAAIAAGRVHWSQGDPSPLPGDPLRLSVGDQTLEVDAILLATGFESRRPGGALVDQLVESHALPCSQCGYPVVDPHLRWHPRVFVSGPLAELELGPVARNIVGARRAAERIVPMAG